MDLMINQKKGSQQGQIALVVVLVMLVVATIGLSVASRTLTDVHLSAQEEEKIRAFSAAEAGLEAILKQGLESGDTTVMLEGIDYSVNISQVGEGNVGYALSEPLNNGETTQIQLVGEGVTDKADGLEIYWNKPASLEISVYGLSNTIKRVAVNPCGLLSTRDNGFVNCSTTGKTYGGKTYTSFFTLSGLEANDSFIRIKSLYDQAELAVKPLGGELPPQAYKAKVTSKQGESTAAVEVIQSAAAVPGIFDYALWSGTGISK